MASRFQQEISSLKPQLIDPTKCSTQTSLYQQILRAPQKVLKEQNKKFNLGNGQLFNDPIQAADQLLAREYADSALFDPNNHEPVFIPPVFQSKQYSKNDSAVHILDYEDVKKSTIKKSLDNLPQKNSPNHWLTKEMQAFYNTQQNITGDEINFNEFRDWILNIKIMYLLIEELGTERVILPITISDNQMFKQACVQELHSTLPNSPLKEVLKVFICAFINFISVLRSIFLPRKLFRARKARARCVSAISCA